MPVYPDLLFFPYVFILPTLTLHSFTASNEMPSAINGCFLLASFKFGFVQLLTLRKSVTKTIPAKRKEVTESVISLSNRNHISFFIYHVLPIHQKLRYKWLKMILWWKSTQPTSVIWFSIKIFFKFILMFSFYLNITFYCSE